YRQAVVEPPATTGPYPLRDRLQHVCGGRPLLRCGRRRVVTERAHEAVHIGVAQVLDLGVVEARQTLPPLRRRPQRLLAGQRELLVLPGGAVDRLVEPGATGAGDD